MAPGSRSSKKAANRFMRRSSRTPRYFVEVRDVLVGKQNWLDRDGTMRLTIQAADGTEITIEAPSRCVAEFPRTYQAEDGSDVVSTITGLECVVSAEDKARGLVAIRHAGQQEGTGKMTCWVHNGVVFCV